MRLKNIPEGTVIKLTLWIDETIPKREVRGVVEHYSELSCLEDEDGYCIVAEWYTGEIRFFTNYTNAFRLKRSHGIKVFQITECV